MFRCLSSPPDLTSWCGILLAQSGHLKFFKLVRDTPCPNPTSMTSPIWEIKLNLLFITQFFWNCIQSGLLLSDLGHLMLPSIGQHHSRWDDNSNDNDDTFLSSLNFWMGSVHHVITATVPLYYITKSQSVDHIKIFQFLHWSRCPLHIIHRLPVFHLEKQDVTWKPV